jgi:hypothetical protein
MGMCRFITLPLLVQPITAHPRARPTILQHIPVLVQPITAYPRALPTNHRARHLLSTSPIVRPSSVTDYPPARLFGTPAPSSLSLFLSLSPALCSGCFGCRCYHRSDGAVCTCGCHAAAEVALRGFSSAVSSSSSCCCCSQPQFQKFAGFFCGVSIRR